MGATLDKSGGSPVITADGYAVLADVVTDPTGDVYLIRGLPPQTVGAVMARLSRSPHGCRALYLDEFHGQAGRDSGVIDRVVTGFGDDSVQQLITAYLVTERISNLMTKLLERPRHGAYLEQSTRYIFFDQKDGEGNYRYYTPPGMGAYADEYRRRMDRLFVLYSTVVREVMKHLSNVRANDRPEGLTDGGWTAVLRGQACDAARAMLPTATTSTVGAVLSAQSVDSLVMYLRSLDLPEATTLADRILAQARVVVGDFLKRTDLPDRGLATTAYLANTRRGVQEFIDQHLPAQFAGAEFQVRLEDYDRDIVPVLAHMLFAGSDRSLTQLEAWVRAQPEEVQRDIVTRYFGEALNRRHKPGRAIERQHYWWEFVGRYGDFRDLQRHRMVDGMEWQRLTPYLGHDIEQLVVEAGMEAVHEESFALSAETYEQLATGFGWEVAQYATLFGHRMRYTFGTNLREAHHLITLRSQTGGHPGYMRIAREMFTLLEQATPWLAEGMRSFVNTSDYQGELTRLAAVRAAEFKQRQALIVP